MKFHETYKGLAHSALGIPMKDDDAKEVDKLLNTGEYEPIRHYSTILESFSPGERSDISVITDGSVDADREVIVPKGVNFERFQKNPIVTFGHNWYSPPIAKSLWQKLVAGNKWKAKTQYASRPETIESKDWMPDKIWHLVKEGFLPGKSIGGLGKVREVTKEDVEKNPAYAAAKGIVDELFVYEYSVVPIQANQNAIVEQVSKSLVSFPDDFLQKNFPDAFEKLKETQEKLPTIKEFRTLEEYRNEIKSKFAEKCVELPNLVDDVLAGVLGEV